MRPWLNSTEPFLGRGGSRSTFRRKGRRQRDACRLSDPWRMDATGSLDRSLPHGFDQGVDGSGVGRIGANVVNAQGYDRAGDNRDQQRGDRKHGEREEVRGSRKTSLPTGCLLSSLGPAKQQAPPWPAGQVIPQPSDLAALNRYAPAHERPQHAQRLSRNAGPRSGHHQRRLEADSDGCGSAPAGAYTP